MNIALLISASLIAATSIQAQPPSLAKAAAATLPASAAALAAGASPAADESPAAGAQPLDPKAQAKAAKLAEKAERKRMKDLRKKYGEGPYPDEIEAYLADKPEELRPLYQALFTGGERNAVLNFERLGLAAMDLGYWSDAELAFDGALARIEAIYADSESAARARSVFHNEANKDFKGEPYERAMAYYYRGLLYLRTGDYGNARASFKSAEYQDTISETESFRDDFAVMNYLTGWTYHCQGQATSASEAFALARENAPGLQEPGPGDSVLLIAEIGRGPLKARDGKEAEKLVFQPAPAGGVDGASYGLGASPLALNEASSVYYQATTRGGRAIDGILDGKASFKQTTGAIGDIASVASLTSSLSGGDVGLGGGLAAAGALFSMFSSSAKTQADIRGWDTLPDRIMLSTAAMPANGFSPTVSYSAGGSPAGDAAQATMSANPGKCAVAWSRSESSEGVSPAVPGEDEGVAKALARKREVQQKDKLFRNALVEAGRGTTLAVGGAS